MNNANILFKLILWVGMISFFFGCTEEVDIIPKKMDGATTKQEQIVAARNWYNRQQVKSPKTTRGIAWPTQTSDLNPLYSESPSWKVFTVTKNDSLIVVDVDMTDCVNQDFVTDDNAKAYENTGNWNFRRSYTRLVYQLNCKTNQETGFLMTIVPSKEYAQKYSNRMRQNTYLHRDKYLSGYVLYHQLDGLFVNGWEYEQGKVTGKIRTHQLLEEVPGTKRIMLKSLYARYLVDFKMHTPAKTRSYSEDGWDSDGGSLPEIEITPDEPYHWPELDTDPWGNYPEPPYVDPFDPDLGNRGEGGMYEPSNPNDSSINKPIKGENYQKAIDDKLVIGKLPLTMDKQVGNTCVTSIMEYINYIFNGNKDINIYNNDYHDTYNKFVVLFGVESIYINEFVNKHFITNPFVSYQESINKGEVVMTDIPSDAPGVTHNVAIIGYHTSGDLIFMDPLIGRLQEAPSSFFKEDYIFSISGNK